MNKICTSINQSNKLIELGIDVNTADIYYTTFYGKVNKHLPMPKEVYDILNCPINNNKVVPAWSLTALLNILPYKIELSQDVIDVNGNIAYKNECYKCSINRCGLFGDKWNIQYYGKHQRQLGERYKELYIDLFFSENYNNLVDACYEMILKLNELKIL